MGDADRIAEGMTRLEEVLDVLIDTGGRPGVETGLGALRLVVLAGMHAILLRVLVVGFTAVTRILGKVGDQRTPGNGCVRNVLACTSLRILELDLGIDGRGVESVVGAECDVRLAGPGGGALLGGDDDHTVGSAHAVQGGSGLAFQDVDALDVVRIDIQGTAGIVGTGHGIAGADVRRGSHGHAVHHI